MSIQRQFNRGLYDPGSVKILDKFNDSLEGNNILHATKGYRTYSVRRGKAALITAEMKKGKFPLAIQSWRTIKEMLQMQGAI